MIRRLVAALGVLLVLGHAPPALGVAEFRPLPRFTQVAPNVWVPFDLPAFVVQGEWNAGLMVGPTGVPIPSQRAWVAQRYSSRVEFVFGGGGHPRLGVPLGTYGWTRGKGNVRPNGLYGPNKTTFFWSPTAALNEQLLNLPRTNNLRVYAWCNSAATPGLHDATQLRLRLHHAWNLPFPGWVPDAQLEAPGFRPVQLSGAQAAQLIFDGQMDLPVKDAKLAATLLKPGGYVDAPFDNRYTRVLPDRYFAALNNSLNLKRFWRWGNARIPWTPHIGSVLGGASFALLAYQFVGDVRKHGFAGAAAGLAVGIGLMEGARWGSLGAVAAAEYAGWARTAAMISRTRVILGRVALPLFVLSTALSGADLIAGTNTIENLSIILYYRLHPELFGPIPGPPDLAHYYD